MPVLLVSYAVQGEWLCREASSFKSGRTVIACGVGQGQNLESARAASRESAIEEFKRICQLSEDCSDYDYSVVPKRTDCDQKNNTHICYRALDFQIGEVKRKSVALDVTDLEVQLKLRNSEIAEIQNRIEKINLLRQADSEANQKRQELVQLEDGLNQKEAEILKLQDLNSQETIEAGEYRYLHQIYKNSIKLSFHLWDSKLTDNSETDILWLLAYENRPFAWLGFQIYGGFGKGRLENQKASEDEVPTMGPPSSNQSYNGSVAYTDVGLSVLAYSGWKGTYLRFDMGSISGYKESYGVDYNGAGVGKVETKSNKFSSAYHGASLGFDTKDNKKGWGMFTEIGTRKLTTKEQIGVIGAVGFNYGF